MKIRIRVNQPACDHRDLTLNGRYLTLKGLDLRRSRERYTCDACGKPLVRTIKSSLSEQSRHMVRADEPARRTPFTWFCYGMPSSHCLLGNMEYHKLIAS